MNLTQSSYYRYSRLMAWGGTALLVGTALLAAMPGVQWADVFVEPLAATVLVC